jgi:hypothetical protein
MTRAYTAQYAVQQTRASQIDDKAPNPLPVGALVLMWSSRFEVQNRFSRGGRLRDGPARQTWLLAPLSQGEDRRLLRTVKSGGLCNLREVFNVRVPAFFKRISMCSTNNNGHGATN